jgi:hypothetical protein
MGPRARNKDDGSRNRKKEMMLVLKIFAAWLLFLNFVVEPCPHIMTRPHGYAICLRLIEGMGREKKAFNNKQGERGKNGQGLSGSGTSARLLFLSCEWIPDFV